MSLVALGWAVTAYNHALRKAYKGDYVISWPSLLLQTLWHIAMVASRVAAIVLFTSLYKAWIFLFLGNCSIYVLLFAMHKRELDSLKSLNSRRSE